MPGIVVVRAQSRRRVRVGTDRVVAKKGGIKSPAGGSPGRLRAEPLYTRTFERAVSSKSTLYGKSPSCRNPAASRCRRFGSARLPVPRFHHHLFKPLASWVPESPVDEYFQHRCLSSYEGNKGSSISSARGCRRTARRTEVTNMFC